MKNNIMISLIVLIVFIISSVAASAVSYYASPSGAGDGSSESSPFKVTDFISLATPGDTLYLLDGTYKNVDSMVEIRHKNGAQDKPITIKALNDGKVTIDAEFRLRPCYIRNCSYIHLEGLVCRNSVEGVVSVIESQFVEVKKVSSYDTKDGDCNCHNFLAWNSEDILYEDLIAGGRARTQMSALGSKRVTIRRMFGYWQDHPYEGSNGIYGIVLQLYGTPDSIVENVIATRDPSYYIALEGIGIWNHEYNTMVGSNNKILGSMTFDVGHHYGFFDSGTCKASENNQFVDIVSLNNKYQHLNRGDSSMVVNHMTAVGNGEETPAFYMSESGPPGHEWIYNCKDKYADGYEPGFSLKTTFTNSIFADIGEEVYALRWKGKPKTVEHDYNQYWNIGSLGVDMYGNAFTLNSNEQMKDPSFNTAKWGKGAYMFPEGDRMNGGDGTYLGADLRYMYIDGVKTNQRLWPWPMEDRVCDELGISVTWEDNGNECTGGLWKTLDGVYDGSSVQLPEDINNDGIVDIIDLILLIRSFGTTQYDLTGDGNVDVQDLLKIIKFI